MFAPIRLALLLSACLLNSALSTSRSQANDLQTVYRLQPSTSGVQEIPVEPEEIQPGLAYNYYHPGLQRRVWGFATEQHGFEYAFGEGTLLPTTRFDLRLSEEAESQILSERAPGLKEFLSTVGRSPTVRLNADGQWHLIPVPVSERIFDLLSGRRWEWHGSRRLAVLHTGGPFWHVVEGEYWPVSVASGGMNCRH